MRTITLGLPQLPAEPDPGANLSALEKAIRRCSSQGAQVICLQELATTLYFCQEEIYEPFGLAEAIPGPSTEHMAALAKELGVVLVLPLFERRAAGIYHNSAVVIDADGSLLGTYRKMHIPDDPGFYEKFYFTPGDLGFRAFETAYGVIGVLICWDQWFPEAARLTALHGAEILFYPTAIGWKPGREDEARQYHHSWRASMLGHAVANGVYVAAVNRVGMEEGLRFWGRSFLADPSGQVVAEAGEEAQELVVTADLSAVEETRRHWPFLRDRRIDAYEGLLHRYLGDKK